MTAVKKSAGQGSPRPTTPSTAQPAPEEQATRKPWKKKTPVEVMVDQINRVRENVQRREEELNQAKRQMQKLEEARKVLESI